MSEVPDGWVTASLADICLRLVDGSHNPPPAAESGRPMLSARNVNDFRVLFEDYRVISEHNFELENARTQVAQGDVLLTIVGTIGRTAVVSKNHPSFALQRSVAVLKPRGVESRYLAYALDSSELQQWLVDNAKGTAQKGVYLKTLGAAQIRVAPLAEQTRIVTKLEELLSDLDAGVAELKAAQKKLGQYRQSLLKAAVEGALTAEWRAKNTPSVTGAQLLQRILTERRVRWEAKQLAKFAEQGKTPPKDWQKKYPEPVQPETTDLPELPKGWVYASVDQLLLQLRSGSSETSIREVTAFPVLKSSAVRPGVIDYRALNYLTSAQSRTENWLEPGDLLISRLSGSLEYVGCCALVHELPHGRVQYPDRLFCGKLVEHTETLGSHIVICFSSPHARAKIEKAAKSTAGHKRISLSDLHPFAIGLPPLKEAQALIRIVETALGEIARQETAIQLALKQSTAQRQNILRAAFAGQLVPQDPNDEPASVLLERIRAERAAKATSKKPRGRKAKEAA